MSRISAALLVAALCQSPLFGADTPFDIVFTDRGRTLRFRFHVQIGDAPAARRFATAHHGLMQALFDQLDQNDDGRLSEKEAAAAPSPQMSVAVGGAETSEANVAFNFRAVDEDGDTVVTPAELADYYEYFGDGAVRFRITARGRADTAAADRLLWQRLDANADQKITLSELGEAPAVLAMDRDNNGVVTVGELGGLSLPVTPNPAAEVTLQSTSPNRQSRTPFRRRPAGSEPADVDIYVSWSSDGPGTQVPTMRIEVNAEGIRSQVGSSSEGVRGVLSMSGLRLALHGLPARQRATELAAGTLKREFLGADDDGDGVVAGEDRMPDFLAKRFQLCDANGDGKLTHKELTGYLSRVLPAEASLEDHRLVLSVSRAGTGLFDFADRNRDERIGLRELRLLADAGDVLDVDNDKQVERGEVPRTYRITIQRGALATPYASVSTADAGPPWFYRMDRNRDGDLSTSEFLGALETFEQIDANSDGLISLIEGLQFELARSEAAGTKP